MVCATKTVDGITKRLSWSNEVEKIVDMEDHNHGECRIVSDEEECLDRWRNHWLEERVIASWCRSGRVYRRLVFIGVMTSDPAAYSAISGCELGEPMRMSFCRCFVRLRLRRCLGQSPRRIFIASLAALANPCISSPRMQRLLIPSQTP
jgi:hypothetical protein